jgi:hypothetical protein
MQIDHNPIIPDSACEVIGSAASAEDDKKVVAKNLTWYTGGLSIFQAIEEGFSPESIKISLIA